MEQNFFSARSSLCLEANIIKFPQHDLSQCFLFYSSCWSRPTVQCHKCVWVRESVKSWAEEETGWFRRKDDSRCSRGAGFSSHLPGLFSCTTSISPDVSLQSNHCMWMDVCMYVCSLVHRLHVIVCDVWVTLRVHMLLLLPLRRHGHHQLWWIRRKRVQGGPREAPLPS